MKKFAVYPGTFDPITLGHLEIIERACRWFDGIIVAIATSNKKNPMLDSQVRYRLIQESIKDLSCSQQITVCIFDTLLVDFCRQKNAMLIIRGMRGISDFEVEFQMALTNNSLDKEIETVFFMTSESRRFISSSLVKEVFMLGGDVSSFVPKSVIKAFKNCASIDD